MVAYRFTPVFIFRAFIMSVLPLYLSSFSNVAPHHRGNAGRLDSGQTDRAEKAEKTESVRKNDRKNNESLLVRNGDVVSDNGDVFSLSSEAKQSVAHSEKSTESKSSESETKKNDDRKTTQSDESKEDVTKELSEEEMKQVTKLKQRDTEVKAHEAAHLAAAGGLARGGASYEYQKGPDGKNYAVGGEVSIDTSSIEGDPESTLSKAKQIRNAALAPADPSAQDYMVAAKASQMETQARKELADKNINGQDSSGADSAQKEDDAAAEDSAKNQNSSKNSPQFSKSAASKYAIQSLPLKTQSQAAFRAIA